VRHDSGVDDAVAERVIWLSPSPPAELATERVAEILAGKAEIAPKNLEVWNPEAPVDYSLASEVDGIRRFAQARRWPSYHLVGFSAAATVLLAAVLQGRLPAKSLTVIEPATIGDDDWSDTEAVWRRRIDEIFAMAPAAHQQAFNQQMLAPGTAVPARKVYPDEDIARDVLLYEGAIRNTGFASSELKAISEPVLVVTGGASHPRFSAVARRLNEVLPHADLIDFPTCSHLRSPQRNEPAAFSTVLIEHWGRD
jgi:pimeloyl-ACP methyl ester carboxylesterase